MFHKLDKLGIYAEEASRINPISNVYSVHIRDKECGLMMTNDKSASVK